ncbi:ATP-binding cassette domain-containing protein [Psychrobacter sp. I-STPA10]|uniref:ATP-binding cassette domain-containing protein n=1 Tax=Psychrobacter sp. I-STPA10 TaxID=2585769 RepID=UPI001E576C1A|nr:ABC transporter ATP-binding protein [Psychrobacter sp. I-STPA10]
MEEVVKDFYFFKKSCKIAKINYKNIFYHFFLITILVVFIAIIASTLPLLLKIIVDSINTETKHKASLYLIVLAGIYGIAWIANESSDWIKGALTSYFLSKIEISIYIYFMDKVFKSKYYEQKRIDKGKFLSEVKRAGESSGQLFYILFWTILPISVQFLFSLYVIMKNVNTWLSVFIGIFLISSLYLSIKISNKSKNIHPIIYSAKNLIDSHTVSRLNFLFEIKTNNNYKYELESCHKVGEEFVSKIFKANVMSAKLMLVQIIFIGILLITSNMYLIIKIPEYNYTSGDFVMISGYIIQLSTPIIMLSQFLIQLKGHFISISDILKYLDLNEDSQNKQIKEIEDFDLVFYAKNMTINTNKKISFGIKRGYWYSIIGSSGSGKSTFIKSILKLHDTSHEKLNFFGIDIDTLSSYDIISYVSVVNQDTAFFKDSLENNLFYSSVKERDLDYVSDILRKLNLNNFVEYIYSGSNDWIDKASGGELQRLSIVRAYLREKSIIILDEPTSALDGINSNVVLKFVEENFDTIIMITHDRDSLVFSDYIMDLDEKEPRFIDFLAG